MRVPHGALPIKRDMKREPTRHARQLYIAKLTHPYGPHLEPDRSDIDVERLPSWARSNHLPSPARSRVLAAVVKLTVVAGENLTVGSTIWLPAESVAPGR